jgi:hypothetical protein
VKRICWRTSGGTTAERTRLKSPRRTEGVNLSGLVFQP